MHTQVSGDYERLKSESLYSKIHNKKTPVAMTTRGMNKRPESPSNEKSMGWFPRVMLLVVVLSSALLVSYAIITTAM